MGDESIVDYPLTIGACMTIMLFIIMVLLG
jgi:hypothetical protein